MQSRHSVWILMIVGSLTTACFTGMRLALILNVLTRASSPLVTGFVTSLMMLMPVLLSIRIGRWADQKGHVYPSSAGALLIAAGAMLCGTAPSLVTMAIAAVAVGLGQTLSHVSVMNDVGY